MEKMGTDASVRDALWSIISGDANYRFQDGRQGGVRTRNLRLRRPIPVITTKYAALPYLTPDIGVRPFSAVSCLPSFALLLPIGFPQNPPQSITVNS